MDLEFLTNFMPNDIVNIIDEYTRPPPRQFCETGRRKSDRRNNYRRKSGHRNKYRCKSGHRRKCNFEF